MKTAKLKTYRIKSLNKANWSTPIIEANSPENALRTAIAEGRWVAYGDAVEAVVVEEIETQVVVVGDVNIALLPDERILPLR